MSWYNYLRKVYSRCNCDTSTTDLFDDTVYGGTAQSHSSCPYCTNTTDGYTKEETEERWRKEQEREDLQIMELGRLVQRIKSRVIVPHISHNIINKTMSRRMMNGRR